MTNKRVLGIGLAMLILLMIFIMALIVWKGRPVNIYTYYDDR